MSTVALFLTGQKLNVQTLRMKITVDSPMEHGTAMRMHHPLSSLDELPTMLSERSQTQKSVYSFAE